MNKKYIWSFVGALTLFSLWFSYTYFDKAIPFVHVSITMNKQEAEKKAVELAKQYNWNIESFDQAVKFEENRLLQNFAELEGGGKEAYVDMIKKEHHQPYIWQVRFFKEKEIFETFVWFTPKGKPYGFSQKLPESQTGNNVSKSKAQRIAEDGAESWDVDLKPYKLLEYEEQVRPSGRVDHTFTYEREDISLQKGLYRVKVTVSADQLTGLQHVVKIPDEFVRRYSQMYSTNILITVFAQGTEVLLYLFILGLFGLFFLYRRRYLLVGATYKMMAVFASLLILASLNNWPLVWNNYTTTTPKMMFILQQLGGIIVGTIMFSLFVGFICLTTEAMGRYVFSWHVQWFRVWDKQVAGSYTIAEQTVLGYCGAAIMLAFMFAFYMVAHGWGWWTPLQNKIDPNILSSYVPFFSPVVYAFRAGFWEEFASRGLPIAGILLLTQNLKNRRFWFWFMIVAQAVLFGAAHANYPMQPAYYRVVEIFIPSLGFAWMYYTFGLLPGIITHGIYDTIYYLIPIFASKLLLQKICGVLMAGIPLWIVLYRWIQQGGLKQLSKSFYNDAWKTQQQQVQEKKVAREAGSVIPHRIKQYVWIFGAVGLLLFATSKEFYFNTPRVVISKQEAEQVALKVMKEEFGDNIGHGWQVLSRVEDTIENEGNKFIWQTYGSSAYEKLQTSYVIEPYYSVKLVKFDGPVEQRAEEYGAWISGAGIPLNVWHKLPEAAKGADISESQAQSKAYDIVQKKYNLEKKDLQLVSSDSVKHEHRRDWTIVLQDTNFSYKQGQARIKVGISGDEIVTCYQFIHAPEEWKRSEQERLTKTGLIQLICNLLMMLFYACFLYVAFARFGISKQLLKTMGYIGIVIFILRALSIINRWDQVLFVLNTAQPFWNQVSSILMSSFVTLVAGSIMLSLFLVSALWMSKRGVAKEFASTIVTGICAGLGYVGLWSFLNRIEPLFQARSPKYELLNYKSSILGMLEKYFFIEPIWSFIGMTAILVVARHLHQKYQYEYVGLGLFICMVTISSGATGSGVIWFTLLLGAVLGFVWYLLFRYLFSYNIELLLITVTTIQVLRIIPSALYGAYPLIMMDISIVAVIAMLIMIFTYKKLVSA